jgi:glycine/D-amino acid oxidase-like deaminating enzyme
MGPQVDPVSSDALLPNRADIVIIGGGIIGVSSAMFLAERGMTVVLVEKGNIAGEQSSRNWGWCRQSRRDPRELDLIRESLALWRGMNARVNADTGFCQAGTLFAARDDATEQYHAEWIRCAAGSGITATIVSGADLRRLVPGDNTPPRSAIYCASDGRAEPQRAAPAMAFAARRAGATIVTACAARGIEIGGGRVRSVVTERGAIACDSVIVAGGAWSRRILSDVGITLPQLKVRSSVARTSPIEGGPECAFWDHVFAFRKRADGGYTIGNGNTNVVPITPDSFRFMRRFIPIYLMDRQAIDFTLDGRFLTELKEATSVALDRPSPYEGTRVLDPDPDLRYLEAAWTALKKRLPVFASGSIVQSWAGYIDAMPDAVPVISGVDGISGLIIATGFSGHGFGIGPGAGQLVADLASGVRPIVDPREFRLSRYSDGSRPRPVARV